MDLSFPRFVSDAEVTEWPTDLAVLLVGVAARQAASRTAAVQALGVVQAATRSPLLAPRDGAFNGPMATALARWRDG